MKRFTQFTTAALAVITLAAVTPAGATLGRNAERSATTIQVKGGEFFFKLSAGSAPRGTVTFVFKNLGQVAHDFQINRRKTPSLQPGRSARLVVRFTSPGKYPFSCTIPGHAQAGMKGVFTIR
jgi:uncharacterized cupredoxin-like copper-binding protein